MNVENVLKQPQQELVAVLDGKRALEKSNADMTDAMQRNAARTQRDAAFAERDDARVERDRVQEKLAQPVKEKQVLEKENERLSEEVRMDALNSRRLEAFSKENWAEERKEIEGQAKAEKAVLQQHIDKLEAELATERNTVRNLQHRLAPFENSSEGRELARVGGWRVRAQTW